MTVEINKNAILEKVTCVPAGTITVAPNLLIVYDFWGNSMSLVLGTYQSNQFVRIVSKTTKVYIEPWISNKDPNSLLLVRFDPKTSYQPELFELWQEYAAYANKLKAIKTVSWSPPENPLG